MSQGSEENFAYLMNGYATELGMENTSFNNATGLPDPLNVTSAYDLALLTSALINEFPEHYKLYSEKSYTYAGIKQPNRNRLLWRSEIFDGAKTGYHSQAGYCLVGSAIRGDMRLVAVVLGSENDKRFNDVSALMDYGFRYFVTEKLFSESEPIKDLRVVAGVSDFVSIGLKEDIILTLQKNKRDNLSFEVSAGSQILAPINAYDKAGTLKVIDDENNVIVETDLIYLDSVEELGFFQRLIAILWNWIKSLFS
jgi:D-alanyl-D-alanine carboxypeptidase (penicillin-binding protein 5/6)